jgi:hypothetical protein
MYSVAHSLSTLNLTTNTSPKINTANKSNLESSIEDSLDIIISNEDADFSHLVKQIENFLDNETTIDQNTLHVFPDQEDTRDLIQETKSLGNTPEKETYLLKQTRSKSLEKIEDKEFLPGKSNKYGLITKRIDTNKIRNKSVKNAKIYSSTLRNVKIHDEESSIRSGVIIYTHYKGKTYFCLGVDSTYGDLTDFSGGKKLTETIAEGGLRELEEESLGVFGKISPEEIMECLTFYTFNMVIIFVHRNVDMDKIKKNFKSRLGEKIKNQDKVEVSDICWLEKKEFIDSINGKGKRLYSRVKRILSKTVEIISAL